MEGLEDAGIEVVYLEIDDATNADPAQGIPTFTGMASANPDLKAAFFDHGNLTSTAQSFLESAGLGPDDIYVAGFDLWPATVAAVQNGYTDLVIDQQQWLQGFEAVAQICLTVNYGFSGLNINTGGGFLDASNVDRPRAARRAADPLDDRYHAPPSATRPLARAPALASRNPASSR